MTRSVRALGVAGAIVALLLSGACGGGDKKPKADTGKVVTSPLIRIKAYDVGSGALQYQATQQSTDPDAGVQATGPVRTGTVAKDAQVLSAANICSGDDATMDEKTGLGTKACTLQQFGAAMKDQAEINAFLTMRGKTITKIVEKYQP